MTDEPPDSQEDDEDAEPEVEAVEVEALVQLLETEEGGPDPTRPNPLPMTVERADRVTLDNVERFKNWDCKFYEKCLYYAAKNNWPQWHCLRCQAFEEAEPDDLERATFARIGQVLSDL